MDYDQLDRFTPSFSHLFSLQVNQAEKKVHKKKKRNLLKNRRRN